MNRIRAHTEDPGPPERDNRPMRPSCRSASSPPALVSILVAALLAAACSAAPAGSSVTEAAPPPVETTAVPATTVIPTSPPTTAPPPASTPPPTASPDEAATPVDGGLDLDALVAFVEMERGRAFRFPPGITLLPAGPRPDEPDRLDPLDWSLLQLLGLATDAQRAGFSDFFNQHMTASGWGECCPVVAQQDDDDPDVTAAIVVHELVHFIDRVEGTPGIRTGPDITSRSIVQAVTEGNAVRVEERFLESIGRTLAEIRVEDDALPADAPRQVMAVLRFPRVEGREFAAAVAAARGEAGVDAAFEALPTSSEQIMFPEAYLSGDEPAPVDTPELRTGVRQARVGTIGAFILSLAVEDQIGSDAARELVSRWAGDTYVLGRTGDQICLTTDVVMDDAQSAAELAEALDLALGSAVVEMSGAALRFEQCRTEVR